MSAQRARGAVDWRRTLDGALEAVRFAGGVAVAVVAGVACYLHTSEAVAEAGEVELAKWMPASVEGLAILATLTWAVLRRRRQSVPWTVVLALVTGLGMSLAGNLLAADPPADANPWRTAVSYAWAGWPTAALVLAIDLLLPRRRAADPAATSTDSAASAVDNAGDSTARARAERLDERPATGELRLVAPALDAPHDTAPAAPVDSAERARQDATTRRVLALLGEGKGRPAILTTLKEEGLRITPDRDATDYQLRGLLSDLDNRQDVTR